MPNKQWGGHGSLGCDIGYGYLHQIPTKEIAPSEVQPPESKPTEIRATAPYSTELDEDPLDSPTHN